MNNYPVGAENDKNAPFNKEESLQGNEIGLFEYLETLEMPYNVRCELKKFEENRIKVIEFLKVMQNSFHKNEFKASERFVFKMQKMLSEPQIFIEE